MTFSDAVPAQEAWRFDHLGVAVKSLAKGRRSLETALGISEWTEEIADAVNGVRLQFGRDRAGVVYELLEPLGENSPVSEALRSKRALLNHVAYRVRDLDAALEQMRAGGAMPTSQPNPAIAYGGARIQFFVNGAGFIVELIEAYDFEIFGAN